MYNFLKKIWRKIKKFFSKKEEKPQALEDCSKQEILRRVEEFLRRIKVNLAELPESFFRGDFADYREFLTEPFVLMNYSRYEKDHKIEVRVHD